MIEFCLCTVLRHHQVHPPVSIVITKRRAARFAVNPDAGLLSWHRRQFSGAVAAEPQTAPGVESRCFRLCREKVLAEKNVFVSVTIHVGHTHGEYRRKLRFGRQCHSFKMVSAVEENHRRQRVGLQLAGEWHFVAQHAVNVGFGERLVRREFCHQKWQRSPDRTEVASRHDARLRIIFRLQQINVAESIPVAKIKPRGMLAAGVTGTVESPVADNKVQSPVAVEVSGGHAGPPTREASETQFFGGFTQFAGLVFEHPHRAPFTGQNQFRKPIAIDIAPNRAANQADILKKAAVLSVQLPLPAVVAIKV